MKSLDLLSIVICAAFVLCLSRAGDCAEGTLLPQLRPYTGKTVNEVDATTIKGKVLCGYQMWFRAPGDGVANGWQHWGGSGDKISADKLTVEMWPDMTEYPPSERFAAGDMKHKDGKQAYLFSSIRPKVADLHFQWMRAHGIDGVFVQRFLCGCNDVNTLNTSGSIAYARDSANRYGRVWSITYDLSGADNKTMFEKLVRDWKFLVDEMKITQDKRYLHEKGRPVLEIYGFFPDRFDAVLAGKIVDFFKNDPKFGVFLVGAGAWWWRNIEDPGWPKVYRSFDAIKPWNVGNTMKSKDGKITMASSDYWEADVAEARKAGMMYIPCVYPGFAWDNLMRAYNQPQNVGHPISRRGGEFLWEQFVKATQMKVDSVFVAMFDEVDEGTAIFKVTNDPPAVGHYVTYDGKPSDWYLRLVGAGAKMLRGKTPLQMRMPEKP